MQKRRANILPSDLDPISAGISLKQKTTYSDILQRLVRRYLFKQDREKYESEKSETGEIASCTYRCETEDKNKARLTYIAHHNLYDLCFCCSHKAIFTQTLLPVTREYTAGDDEEYEELKAIREEDQGEESKSRSIWASSKYAIHEEKI